MDDNITSNVLEFAVDTKVFRKVNTDGDKQHLQKDLDKFVKWSEKWQMLLNLRKGKCLHTVHGNLDINYNIIKYLSILFLSIFTLLALTQSFGSLFHSFITLCEKEYFLMSNLHCSLTNAALCHLVLLPSLSLKNIFLSTSS